MTALAASQELPAELVTPGERALVVGAGRSGAALAGFLLARGLAVRVCDVRSEVGSERFPVEVELRLGSQDVGLLEGCAVVFASPGVPWDSALLAAARTRDLPVSSEMDLFCRLCPAPMIGITGTNGKTTTTALTARVLERTGRPVLVGGNIGETVLDRVDGLDRHHLVVLELSSFQLESIAEPGLSIGAVLNVTPDHLDRHGSMQAYLDAKARAVEGLVPGGYALLNGQDEGSASLAARARGEIVWFDRHRPVPPMPMPGGHNRLNALAAAAVGRLHGLADEVIAEAVASFPGVEHRLELVGEWGGVRWYNDSKATNPEAGQVALRAFESEPLILIAGGRGHFDLGRWAADVREHVQEVLLIGESADEIATALADHPRVRVVGDMESAVAAAEAAAKPGSVVLLSPAFKSFDQFQDFEARGRRFKALARERQQ